MVANRLQYLFELGEAGKPNCSSKVARYPTRSYGQTLRVRPSSLQGREDGTCTKWCGYIEQRYVSRVFQLTVGVSRLEIGEVGFGKDNQMTVREQKVEIWKVWRKNPLTSVVNCC